MIEFLRHFFEVKGDPAIMAGLAIALILGFAVTLAADHWPRNPR